MIIVEVKGDKIDRALKVFKTKFNKIGVMKELRDRQEFTKNSVKKRKEKLHAVYVQKMKDEENSH